MEIELSWSLWVSCFIIHHRPRQILILCVMPTELWCKGELQGDPDIAGIGVIISILVTTFVAIAFCCLLWVCERWLSETSRESRLYQALLKCVFMLADIQLVTAAAITWSSITLIHSASETSLYHVFVARCLVQANITGHGTALVFAIRKQRNWWLRIILLVCALPVYTYWTVIGIREFDKWSNVTPKCFYNSSLTPGWYTDWMWLDIPWTIVGYLWLLADATGRMSDCLKTIDGWTVDLLLHALKSVCKLLTELRQLKLLSVPLTTSLLRLMVFLFIMLTTVTTAVLRLVVFLFITFTISPPSTLPVCSLVFFLWSWYEVQSARSANQHILVVSPVSQPSTSLQGNSNPENDWGFGQLLPLFLLLLPLLQAADYFTEEMAHGRHTSEHLIARDVVQRHNLQLSENDTDRNSGGAQEERTTDSVEGHEMTMAMTASGLRTTPGLIRRPEPAQRT